jgi:phage host-nuclease inhibitor protein Gam
MAKIHISRLVDRERERERKKANERNFVSIIGAQVQMRKHTATWVTEMESVLGGLSWKLKLDVYVRFLQEIDKENDIEVLYRLPSCSTNSHY